MRLQRKLLFFTLFVVAILALPGAGVAWHAYHSLAELDALGEENEQLHSLTAITSRLYREMVVDITGQSDEQNIAATLTVRREGGVSGSMASTIRHILHDYRTAKAGPAKVRVAERTFRNVSAELIAAAETIVSRREGKYGGQILVQWLLVLRAHTLAVRENLLLYGSDEIEGVQWDVWSGLTARQQELLNGGRLTNLTHHMRADEEDIHQRLDKAFNRTSGLAMANAELSVLRRLSSERIALLRELEQAILARLDHGLSLERRRSVFYAAGVTAAGLLALLLLIAHSRFAGSALLRPLDSLFSAIDVLNTNPQSRVALLHGSDEMAELTEAFERLVDAQQQAACEHRLAAGVFEHALEGIVVTDRKGGILAANPATYELFGYQPESLVGKNVSVFKSGRHDREFYRDMWHSITVGGEWCGEVWNRRADGECLCTRLSIAVVREPYGEEVNNYVAIYTDVTAQRAAEDALRQAHAYKHKLIAAMGEGLYGVDTQGRIQFINPAGERVLGWQEHELLGRSAHELCHHEDWYGEHVLQEHCPLLNVLLTGSAYNGEQLFRRRDGAAVPVECYSTPMVEEGEVTGAIVTFWDITEQRSSRERIQFLAYHDSLTGLPNRTFLMEHLELMLATSRREGAHVGICFLDLNHFKQINDTKGHHVGDAILKTVADRLRHMLRSSDLLARQGGDEFIIVTTCDRETDCESATIQLAQKLGELWKRPFIDDNGDEYHLSGSIGIACYPQHGDDEHALLSHADYAMYKAKKTGRAFVVYSPAEARNNILSPEFEAALRNAVEEERFAIYVQPVVRAETGRVIGGEVLLRWRRSYGMVSPDTFIPLLEKNGLIVPLGSWVLEQAMKLIQQLDSRGQALHLAVNISPRQLEESGLLRTICHLFEHTGIDTNRIELEITETVTQTLTPRARRSLCWLRRQGISLAIDDFGTGHSSLLRLRELPADRLKIDRSFVQELPHLGYSATIVRNTISLAHDLGMTVVAEGVETKEQYDFLQQEGCEYMQGYYVGRPVPAEEFMRMTEASS